MFKTFSIGLALLAGLLGPTQAGYVPTASHTAAQAPLQRASDEAPLDAIGPPPLAPCALGCNAQPLSLIVPPQGEARVPEPAGLALVAVAALASLLVCRIHRRRAASAQASTDASLRGTDTGSPSTASLSVLDTTGAPPDAQETECLPRG